jgi:sugar phosphate isomerase/epimerase
MKLTISTLACPEWSLERIVQVAAANGIDGIDFRGLGSEIDITKLPSFNDGLDNTLALLRAHNLEMPCLNSSVTLVTPAPERWQMMLDEANRSARLAEKTHTRFLRVFGGGVPKDLSREEAALLARRHLRQMMKICHPFGCTPLVETHDEWATSLQMLEIIHEFDPRDVGVLWDIEHPFRRGENPADTFASLRRFIRHVHFKDSVRTGNKNSPRLLGEGELPVRECHALLREGGYDGWVCLETEKRWHAEAPDPAESIPQFATFMRELSAGAE